MHKPLSTSLRLYICVVVAALVVFVVAGGVVVGGSGVVSDVVVGVFGVVSEFVVGECEAKSYEVEGLRAWMIDGGGSLTF